jgi:hypothetical protein
MELRLALEHRERKACSPYDTDAWLAQLVQSGLLDRYPLLPNSLQQGFCLDIPSIISTQAPPNKESIVTYCCEFISIINSEIKKGRYIGLLKANQVENLIGPFQNSPFSRIPKPGRAGRYCVIQNYSFPHLPSIKFPNPSINPRINSDQFPSTWGTFHLIALTISNLPPGSQLATRDVSEAYHTIPLHPSQWPGAVVRVSDDLFCIDTCTSFGLAPSAGAYGVVADAGLDLLRHQGIGPASRWVDDHLFFCILREHITSYNEQRLTWHQEIISRT